jgi:hypothetical protein
MSNAAEHFARAAASRSVRRFVAIDADASRL